MKHPHKVELYHPLLFPLIALVCAVTYILYLVAGPLQNLVATSTTEQHELIQYQKQVLENQGTMLRNQQLFIDELKARAAVIPPVVQTIDIKKAVAPRKRPAAKHHRRIRCSRR